VSNRQRFRRSRGYSDRRVACADLPEVPTPVRANHQGVLVAIGVGLVLGLTLGMVFLAR
jgi:hypothetical protein